MTDTELLAEFKKRHPRYTAATLQSVLSLGRAMSFQVLKTQQLEPYQRRLLRLYLELPDAERKKHFAH